MFDKFLKSYLTNYSELQTIVNTPIIGFQISIDDTGVKLLGGINKNTPPQVVTVYDIIVNKLKKLNEVNDGKGPVVLTDKDLDQIISTAFTEGLGEPDEVSYSVGEEAEDLVTYTWDFGGGELKRTVAMPKREDEINRMDKNSLEYFNAMLNQAIIDEDYKKAAEYRDKINNFS